MYPTRYTLFVDVVRKKYGSRADTLAAYLSRADPRADNVLALFARHRLDDARRRRVNAQRGRTDAEMFNQALHQGVDSVSRAPPDLRALFEHLEQVPVWLNRELLDLGARTYARCGALSAVMLGCGCLPLAYRSGAGNKPLAFTRQLMDRAVRRLSKTGEFFMLSCLPGALVPHAAGWKKTVEVRMQHAQMRRLLRQMAWKEEHWGLPINQLDLAGTSLLFSVNLVRHLRQVGFHFSAAESEAIMHLWRYSGYLLGIEPELLCATETEGRHLAELIFELTGAPDEDSRTLIRALMEVAMPAMMEEALPWLVAACEAEGEARRRGWLGHLGHSVARLMGLTSRSGRARFCYGLSHGLLRGRAAELQYPRTTWRYTAPWLLRTFVAPLETCRRFIPGATRLAHRLGASRLERAMGNGTTDTFASPSSAPPRPTGADKQPPE
jgi:hypothetical protein